MPSGSDVNCHHSSQCTVVAEVKPYYQMLSKKAKYVCPMPNALLQ